MLNEAYKPIFEMTFTTAQIAAVVGRDQNIVATWVARKLVTAQRDDQPGRGRSRVFSFFNVMEIACASALMDAGINSPKLAFAIACRFSHSVHASATWDDGIAEGSEPDRHPSLPFHHKDGDTWLIVSGEASSVVLSSDGAIRPDAAFPPNDRGFGYVVLNVSKLFEQVCARLDLGDYRVILDREYSAG